MGAFDFIKGLFKKESPIRAVNFVYNDKKIPDPSGFYLDSQTVKSYIDAAIRAYVSVPEFAAAVETLKADIIAEGWRLESDDEKRIKYIRETLDKLNFNQILETFVTDLLVTSNAFLEFRPIPAEVFEEFIKMQKGRKPSKAFALWNIAPTSMSIFTDEHGKVVEYVQNYGAGDAEIHFKPDEIIHLSINRPANLPYGIPYAASVDKDLALLEYAKAYVKKFFKNSAIPDLAVIYADKGVIPDKRWKEIVNNFKSLKGTNNSHRTILLQGDFRFEKLNDFKKDMEFLELINRARENIWSVYGTPADRILGVKDRDLNSYYSKVNYLQKIIESFLNSKVFSQFGVRFVMNRTYQVDELRVTQRYVMLVQNGILTPDEARAELGYKPGAGKDLHPNEFGNAQLPERDVAVARPRGGDGISDAPTDRGANLDNIPEKSGSVDMKKADPIFFDVDFDSFKLMVEKKSPLWNADITYYEGEDRYVLYWKDGTVGYKAVVKKEDIEDEEIFRFEYLRNAVRTYTEL